MIEGVTAMLLKIREWRNKIFHRILFTYSVIILLCMFLLFSLLSQYYTEVVVQRELDANTRILERVETYFNRKHDYVDSVFKELYFKTDLIEDISFALQHDYNQYLSYRLDRYSESSSFVPSDLETFIENYFSQDSDVNAVSINSDATLSEYLYIFNHYRWSQSVNQVSEINLDKDFLISERKSSGLVNDISQRSIQNSYHVTKKLNDPGTLKKLGDISIYYSFEGLENLLHLRQQQLKGTVLIYNNLGDLLYPSKAASIEKEGSKPDFQTILKKTRIKGETYYVNTLADERSQLMIVGLIPEKEIQGVTLVHRTMLLITILLTAAAILLTYIAMRKYSKRIQVIEHSMSEVQKGNLDVRIQDVHQKDELSMISTSFNQMAEDLNRYIDQMFISEIKQKEAEMKALQSQINPHFLYNTLEAIRMKAIADGSKTTSTMIYYLAQLFRYSLKDSEAVTVQDEIEHVKQYLQLFQVRYPERLHVHYDIEEQVLNYEILKFMLQPIVENYVIHGLKKHESTNHLYIGVHRKQTQLIIMIRDNGRGIAPDRLADIQKRLKEEHETFESIGLSNVLQRIRLRFRDEYGLIIDSTVDAGTEVQISMPIIGGNEQDV